MRILRVSGERERHGVIAGHYSRKIRSPCHGQAIALMSILSYLDISLIFSVGGNNDGGNQLHTSSRIYVTRGI